MVVEYDGSALAGWQRQPGQATVQGHLEAALSQLCAQPTTCVSASRTDAGVHATGQVVCFLTDKRIPPDGVRRGLNSLLPDTVAVRVVEEVPLDFHPRFCATGKHYRYLLWTRPARSPHWRTRAWYRAEPLDRARMQVAAQALIGEHDFAAFRAVGCAAKSTRRRITDVRLTDVGPHLLGIDVVGNAFLRNMVRIIAGTLVDVGLARIDVTSTARALASGLRTDAGMTAPGHGLELVEVFFDGSRRWVRQGAAATAVGGSDDGDQDDD